MARPSLPVIGNNTPADGPGWVAAGAGEPRARVAQDGALPQVSPAGLEVFILSTGTGAAYVRRWLRSSPRHIRPLLFRTRNPAGALLRCGSHYGLMRPCPY